MSNISIHTFDEAEEYIGQEYTKRLPGSHMYMTDAGGDEIAINYYDTPIVTFLIEGGYKLNSGGWRTQSTMTKINKYLPEHIRVIRNRNDVWEVRDSERNNWAFFSDEMEIYPDADREFYSKASGDEAIEAADMRKQANWYVDSYMDCLTAGYLYLEQDAPAIEPSQDELATGKVEFLTKAQAKKVINQGHMPPSLLRRALYVDPPDAYYFNMAENMISLDSSQWDYKAEEIKDAAKKFRRSLHRLIRKSLELTV